MKNYQRAFYLEGERGNNAFAFAERGAEPRLLVPAVVDGVLDDVKVGTEPVFVDRDEFDVLQTCPGLAAFVRTEWEGIPLVVVDNHNHVFYFWMEAFLARRLGDGAFLVHVDQHKDMRVPPNPYRGKSLEDAFDYVNEVLNVGNYIVPAMEAGVVREVQLVTSEMALDEGGFFGKQPKILNVDLDMFAPELSYIDFQKARRFILKHAREAALITVATSPFFIDQVRAIQMLHALFGADPS